MIDPAMFRRYVQSQQGQQPGQRMMPSQSMPQMPQHARIPRPGQQRQGFNTQALGAYGIGQMPRA